MSMKWEMSCHRQKLWLFWIENKVTSRWRITDLLQITISIALVYIKSPQAELTFWTNSSNKKFNETRSSVLTI
jgi:hypothetical protein